MSWWMSYLCHEHSTRWFPSSVALFNFPLSAESKGSSATKPFPSRQLGRGCSILGLFSRIHYCTDPYRCSHQGQKQKAGSSLSTGVL